MVSAGWRGARTPVEPGLKKAIAQQDGLEQYELKKVVVERAAHSNRLELRRKHQSNDSRTRTRANVSKSGDGIKISVRLIQ